MFGVLLNGLVCITFLTYRSLLSKENILIFSMALSDLFCCAIAVPTSLISNLKMKWVFEESGCIGHAFVVTWCGVISITHFTVLSFNRYQTLTLRVNKLFSGKRTVYYVLVLWMYSFVFAIAPVAGWSRYTTEGIGTSCSLAWQSSDANAVSFTVFIFLGCFFAPVGVILFSYCKVYSAVRNMTFNANDMWGKLSILARETARTEAKMSTLIFAMITAFMLSWAPYATVSLISAFGGSHLIGPVVASVPAYIAKSSNLYNPILYFLMYKRFRAKLLKLLRIRNFVRSTSLNSTQLAISVYFKRKTSYSSVRRGSFRHSSFQRRLARRSSET